MACKAISNPNLVLDEQAVPCAESTNTIEPLAFVRQCLNPLAKEGTQSTWHGHSAFRIEAGEAGILIDPFLSDNPSRDNGWSGYLTGENSTQ
jgi:hypothetical protein